MDLVLLQLAITAKSFGELNNILFLLSFFKHVLKLASLKHWKYSIKQELDRNREYINENEDSSIRDLLYFIAKNKNFIGKIFVLFFYNWIEHIKIHFFCVKNSK
jgi:hypothetical protein